MRRKIQRSMCLVAFLALLISGIPVSYTHLDVYKRQEVSRAYWRPCNKYCRMGRILYHRRAQRRTACGEIDKGENEDDLLRGRRQ